MPEKFSISTRQNTDTSEETFVGKRDREECVDIRRRVRRFADILNERENLKRQDFVELVGGTGEHTRLHWFPKSGSHMSLPDGLRMYRMMREAYNRGLIHILLADEL